jgi:hypothetical protein
VAVVELPVVEIIADELANFICTLIKAVKNAQHTQIKVHG